jgi:hypothetical protein
MRIRWLGFGLVGLVVWIGCGSAWATEKSESYAVLVGINRYKASTADVLDRVTNLEQTGYDVQRVRNFLPKIGFSPTNIRVLLDEQATKEGVLAALKWLTEKAKRTDRVLFYFSGHGYQISESEASLVLHDTYRRATHTHLTGTEFQAWAATLGTRKALFLFDSCHAGGLYPKGMRGEMCPSRGGKKSGARARYLPNLELEATFRSRRARGDNQKALRAIRPMLRRSIHLSWSAAQYHQYACESDTDQGGIFTLLWLRGAEALLANTQATFADLIQAYKQQIKQAPYDVYRSVQTPRFLGNPAQPLFFRQHNTSSGSKPSSGSGKACQATNGICVTLWAVSSKPPHTTLGTNQPIGSRIKLRFRVDKASNIRFFIQHTDGKTYTVLFDFHAKPNQTYTLPQKSTKSYRVIGPPGKFLVWVEAWPRGMRGGLLEEEDRDESTLPPQQKPTRVSLQLMAVQP